jgi:hypothetical protein
VIILGSLRSGEQRNKAIFRYRSLVLSDFANRRIFATIYRETAKYKNNILYVTTVQIRNCFLKLTPQRVIASFPTIVISEK